MKKIIRLLALVLTVTMLCGCAALSSALQGVEMVPYSDMEYTRPDMARMQVKLDAACTLAAQEQSPDTLRDLIDAIYAFYDEYDGFYTNYSLADLGTCHDLTDIYWEAEYAYCLEHSAEDEAMLEEL